MPRYSLQDWQVGMQPITNANFFKVGHFYRIMKSSTQCETDTVHEGKVLKIYADHVDMDTGKEGIITFSAEFKVSQPGYPQFYPLKAVEIPPPADAATLYLLKGGRRRKTGKNKRKHSKRTLGKKRR